MFCLIIVQFLNSLGVADGKPLSHLVYLFFHRLFFSVLYYLLLIDLNWGPSFYWIIFTSLKEIHGDLCWEKISISSHVYLIICYCFLSMLNFAELAANDELFNILKPFFNIVSTSAVARFSLCSFMSVFSSVPTTHM